MKQSKYFNRLNNYSNHLYLHALHSHMQSYMLALATSYTLALATHQVARTSYAGSHYNTLYPLCTTLYVYIVTALHNPRCLHNTATLYVY
jgi:hypothetical protein